MESRIGIKQEHLEKIAHELSRILADEFVLYSKTRSAHWNVEGPDFYNMHKFFEQQYEFLDDAIDDVAERIRSLGHYVPSTLKNYLSLTKLSEATRSDNDALSYIKILLADHESIIMHLRENINLFANELGDSGTSDFITGLMEQHEKMAWMLRAHLK